MGSAADGHILYRSCRDFLGINHFQLTDATFLQFAAHNLGKRAEVETAENGKIAVEKVEVSPKDRYDLIFMDIQMPVLNGYQATAAIRSLPGEKGELPIVAMTANAFAEDVQLAKNTGMNGHIAKPLDMNKLNNVLENWL